MLSISSLKRWARQTSPSLYRHYAAHYRASQLTKLAPVLSDPRSPVTLSEAEFDQLQLRYKQWWPQYDFDVYSTGRRAYERALALLQVELLREPGKEILEIACGDGMTGAALSLYGHQVTLLDYQDWRDSRAHGQTFIQADLGEPIPLPESTYDFIFSFNAFEHIPDPALALTEMIRLLKPGGYILIDFNPLYASPLGLHAFCFRMPYPQFLFSDDLIQSKLTDLGLNDLGREMKVLQPLNRWLPQQFREIWHRCDCRIAEYSETKDFDHLNLALQYRQAFRGRSLCVDDLTVSGMRVLLHKNHIP